jgi:hypothetical protein
LPGSFVEAQSQYVPAKGSVLSSRSAGIKDFGLRKWGLIVKSHVLWFFGRICVAMVYKLTESGAMLVYFAWKNVVKIVAIPDGDV